MELNCWKHFLLLLSGLYSSTKRQKYNLARFQILFCMYAHRIYTIVQLVVHSTTVILSYRKCSGLCCYSRVGGKKWGYAPGPQSFYGQKCLKFWLLFGMLKKVHLWGLFFSKRSLSQRVIHKLCLYNFEELSLPSPNHW